MTVSRHVRTNTSYFECNLVVMVLKLWYEIYFADLYNFDFIMQPFTMDVLVVDYSAIGTRIIVNIDLRPSVERQIENEGDEGWIWGD